MKKALFDDLVQNLKEAKAIAKGKAQASRRFIVLLPEAKTIKACRSRR